MEVLVDDADLMIEYEPGNGACGEVVISFSGVALSLGSIHKTEFRNSLRKPRHVRDAYYVSDKRRGWYNSTFDRIRETIGPRVEGRNVYTLGNSMGGFAAILFSLTFDGAMASISFCPQYSISRPLAPFETRWGADAEAIGAWSAPTCLPEAWNVPRPVRHYVFCGEGEPRDVQHAQLIQMAAANPVSVYVFEGVGHGVASGLKQAGALHQLLDAAMQGPRSDRAMDDVLRGSGLAYATWPPQGH